MKEYNEYLDNISVDPALQKRIMQTITAPPKQSQQHRAFVRYVAVATCAIVLVLGVWIVPGFLNNQEQPNYTYGLFSHAPEDRQPDRANIPPPSPHFNTVSPRPRNFTAISLHHVDSAPLIEPNRDAPDTAAAHVAHGANDFTFRLSAALATDIGHDNFVMSPYSVWMPLAALLNATDEAYQAIFLEALDAGGITATDVNRAASRMLFDLTNERARQRQWEEELQNNPIHIANAIFVDRRFTLRNEFAQIFADHFRGEMIQADFSNPQAVEEINLWASDNTHGLIPEVVQSFSPQTVSAIANAIFFSDSWVNKFNPALTQRDIFHSPAGENYAYFMEMELPIINYFENHQVQAIDLPFVSSGGMTVILPKDGDAVALLVSMTNEHFNRIHDDTVLAEGRLLLPRFSIESTLDNNLIDSLAALGVPLFDSAVAPLTGLVEESSSMWINDAVQVAMINIDENGATAAAATVLTTYMGQPEAVTAFDMICNSPFVFVIYSFTSDGGRQVLFTGVVNQP